MKVYIVYQEIAEYIDKTDQMIKVKNIKDVYSVEEHAKNSVAVYNEAENTDTYTYIEMEVQEESPEILYVVSVRSNGTIYQELRCIDDEYNRNRYNPDVIGKGGQRSVSKISLKDAEEKARLIIESRSRKKIKVVKDDSDPNIMDFMEI